MTKFLVTFDSIEGTPAEGLPDRALGADDKPLWGDALIAACSDHFTATARDSIPGLAIEDGPPGSALEVILPKAIDVDEATEVLKSIPGPHGLQLVPAAV